MFRRAFAIAVIALTLCAAAQADWRSAVAINGQSAYGPVGPTVALPDGSFVELSAEAELTRYSADGDLLWRRRGFEHVFGNRIQGTGDGDVLVFGNTLDQQPHVARVAPDGSLRWHWQRGEQGESGGYYQGGDNGSTYRLTEQALYRLRADGTDAWPLAVRVRGQPFDFGVASNGDAIVCPRDDSSVVMRVSPAGTVVWEVGTPVGGRCAVGPDGSVTMAGSEYLGPLQLVHFTAAGVRDWTRTVPGVGDYRIVTAPAGGFVLFAQTSDPGGGADAFVVKRYDASGNLAWSHLEARSILGTPYGSAYAGDVLASPPDQTTVVYQGWGNGDPKVLLDFDAAGNVRRTLLPPTAALTSGNALLTDGGLVVPGWRDRTGGFGKRREMVKLDATRAVEWMDDSDVDVDLPSTTCKGCGVVRGDGSTVLLSHVTSPAVNRHLDLAAFGRDGALLWQRRLATLQDDTSITTRARVVHSPGGYVAATPTFNRWPGMPVYLVRDDGVPITEVTPGFQISGLAVLGNDILAYGWDATGSIVQRIDGTGATVWRRTVPMSLVAEPAGVIVDPDDGGLRLIGPGPWNGPDTSAVAHFAADGTPGAVVPIAGTIWDVAAASDAGRAFLVLDAYPQDTELRAIDAAGTTLWSAPWGDYPQLHPLPDGGLLALDGYGQVTRFSRDGTVRWNHYASFYFGHVLPSGGEVLELGRTPSRLSRVSLDSGETIAEYGAEEPLLAYTEPVGLLPAPGGARLLLRGEAPNGTVSATMVSFDDRISIFRDGME